MSAARSRDSGASGGACRATRREAATAFTFAVLGVSATLLISVVFGTVPSEMWLRRELIAPVLRPKTSAIAAVDSPLACMVCSSTWSSAVHRVPAFNIDSTCRASTKSCRRGGARLAEPDLVVIVLPTNCHRHGKKNPRSKGPTRCSRWRPPCAWRSGSPGSASGMERLELTCFAEASVRRQSMCSDACSRSLERHSHSRQLAASLTSRAGEHACSR